MKLIDSVSTMKEIFSAVELELSEEEGSLDITECKDWKSDEWRYFLNEANDHYAEGKWSSFHINLAISVLSLYHEGDHGEVE